MPSKTTVIRTNTKFRDHSARKLFAHMPSPRKLVCVLVVTVCISLIVCPVAASTGQIEIGIPQDGPGGASNTAERQEHSWTCKNGFVQATEKVMVAF